MKRARDDSSEKRLEETSETQKETPKDRPLRGKIAVVTGSTSGIGLGIATVLADCGASIVLNGLGDTEEIERTRAALEVRAGAPVLYHGANMLLRSEIEARL